MNFLLRNNFLHYGDSLEYSKELEFPKFQEEMYKKELIGYLLSRNINSKYLNEIILNYGIRGKRIINISCFKRDVEDSLKCQNVFRKFRCRGFSYNFFDEMKGFRFQLRKELNLRFALMTSSDLFYPPKVRKHLTSVKRNHYRLSGYPSIAFALGSKIKNDWYIFVIQSDLIFEKPASIREHFRGWRKVILANIVQHASKEADNIFLCTAGDRLKCCHPRFAKPEKLPRNWEIFYDETAKFFNMKMTKTKTEVNIQIFARHKPVYTNQFYKLSFA